MIISCHGDSFERSLYIPRESHYFTFQIIREIHKLYLACFRKKPNHNPIAILAKNLPESANTKIQHHYHPTVRLSWVTLPHVCAIQYRVHRNTTNLAVGMCMLWGWLG